MNEYLEEGLTKSDNIFYKSIINQWSIGFTKPMIDYDSGRFPALLLCSTVAHTDV